MHEKIPFAFVLDYLYPLNLRVRAMFGAYAVYVGEKIMVILRNKESHTESNGIWIATSSEHHQSLKKEIPSLTSIYVLSEGKGETEWQMISSEDENFETLALKICDMILKRDERIGKIPKSKKRKRNPVRAGK